MAGMLEGKVALVTGGASGIGRASVLAFAREGARVVVSDVDREGGEQTAAAVRAAGGEARFVAADVTREDEVAALVAATAESYGGLHCAHNNAGVNGGFAPIHQLDLEAWERTLRINLTGVFLCLKHEIAWMLAHGGGAIVNTSSGAGFVGTPALAGYCASKHGILGLTKTAAAETARAGIRVNAVCPGSVDTPMLRSHFAVGPGIEKAIRASQPGGRLGTPEEIAEAVVWLCSDRASFVNAASLSVDGGAVGR